MSNVIKNASSVTSTTQLGVINKIYEELFTDSSGNVTTRYYRCFKADEDVAAGDLVGCAAAAIAEMYTTGTVGKTPAAAVEKGKIYGVAAAAVADGSYGFVICKGVMESVACEAGISEGSLIASSASTAGRVTAHSTGSGTSDNIIGMACTATSSNTCTMYINLP